MSKIRKQKSYKELIPTAIVAAIVMVITYLSNLDIFDKAFIFVLSLLVLNTHTIFIQWNNKKATKEQLNKMGGNGNCTTVVPTIELKNAVGSVVGKEFLDTDHMNYVTGATVPKEFITGDKTKCVLMAYKNGLTVGVQGYDKVKNQIVIPYNTITKIRIVEENVREGTASAKEAYRKRAGFSDVSHMAGLAEAIEASTKKVKVADVFSIIETVYGEKIYLLMENGTEEQVNKLKQFYDEHTGALDEGSSMLGMKLPE